MLSGSDAQFAAQKLGGGSGSESVRGDEWGEDPGLYSLSGQIPACRRSMAGGAEPAGCGRDEEMSGSCVLLQVALSCVHRRRRMVCTRTRMHSQLYFVSGVHTHEHAQTAGRAGHTCAGGRVAQRACMRTHD